MTMTIPFNRRVSVSKKHDVTDGTSPAAPGTRAYGVLPHFITQYPQRVMRLDVLNGIISCVGIERIHTVQAILSESPSVGTFGDVHVHPVAALRESGVRNHPEVSNSGAYPLGRSLCQ